MAGRKHLKVQMASPAIDRARRACSLLRNNPKSLPDRPKANLLSQPEPERLVLPLF